MSRQKRQHLKRRKDGRYCCVYHGVQFMGNTEDEALEKREAYKRKERSGMIPGKTPFVRQYAPQWLDLYRRNVGIRCYNDYERQLEALCGVIGNKLFSEVSVDDVMRVYKHYDGYSNSTIKRARMIFTALFDAAQENGFCAVNPFRSRIAKPKQGTIGTHRILTQEERDLILQTAHPMRLAALVMLYAGLRRGEALAINIDHDIDLKAGLIRVSKAVRYENAHALVTRTKTVSGERVVPIFPILADALAGASGPLVPASEGGGDQPEGVFTGAWRRYMSFLSKAAGHKVEFRCHDLRHSFCTMLRDSGVDMKLAMVWMGHTDETMILRIYDHVTEERAAENAEKVQNWLSNMQ